MIYEKVSLWPGTPDVFLEVIVPNRFTPAPRKAILVIPGGGYGVVCFDWEGEPIAEAFLPYGFAAFVLHYSIGRTRTFPDQLIEASAAMKYIRDNAERFAIDPEQVFAIGFSAGGHLAGTLGTMWHRKEVYDTCPMPFGYNKPTGVMLIYPVISSDPAIAHLGSIHNLLGTDEPTAEQANEVSLEKHVDERSAPVFLVHTSNDQCVPVENSLRMAEAYRAAGRTFALHIYPNAPHGMSLANRVAAGPDRDRQLETWLHDAVLWTDSLFQYPV